MSERGQRELDRGINRSFGVRGLRTLARGNAPAYGYSVAPSAVRGGPSVAGFALVEVAITGGFRHGLEYEPSTVKALGGSIKVLSVGSALAGVLVVGNPRDGALRVPVRPGGRDRAKAEAREPVALEKLCIVPPRRPPSRAVKNGCDALHR